MIRAPMVPRPMTVTMALSTRPRCESATSAWLIAASVVRAETTHNPTRSAPTSTIQKVGASAKSRMPIPKTIMATVTILRERAQEA